MTVRRLLSFKQHINYPIHPSSIALPGIFHQRLIRMPSLINSKKRSKCNENDRTTFTSHQEERRVKLKQRSPQSSPP